MRNFRRKLELELYCSKHPDQLLSLEIDQSKIGADSAYTLIPKISVDPCDECERELTHIKWAIKKLMDVRDEVIDKANESPSEL